MNDSYFSGGGAIGAARAAMAAPTFLLASTCKCLTLLLMAKAASHDRARRRGSVRITFHASVCEAMASFARLEPSLGSWESKDRPLQKEIAPALL